MLLDAGGEQGAGGSRTALGKGEEEQAAAHLAGRVFDDGQIEGLRLGQVVGDIVEVLGVSGDLLEQTPGGFDVGQVLLASTLSAAGMDRSWARHMPPGRGG